MQGLAELRHRLKDEIAAANQVPEVVGDRPLIRFLRGHQFNIDKAATMYSNYLKWRKEFNVDAVRHKIVHEGYNHPNSFPHAELLYKSIPQVIISTEAFDVHGNPIAVETYNYSPREFLQQITVQDYTEFMLHTMEYKSIVMEQLAEARERKFLRDCNYNPPNGYGVVLSCTIIRDLSGLSMEFLSAEAKTILKVALDISQANYPEILYKSHLVNTSWIFSTVWYFVKGLLDVRTAAKVTTSSTDFLRTLSNEVTIENIPAIIGGKYPHQDLNVQFDTSEFGLLHLFDYSGTHLSSFLEHIKAVHASAADVAKGNLPDSKPSSHGAFDEAERAAAAAEGAVHAPRVGSSGKIAISGILSSSAEHGFEHSHRSLSNPPLPCAYSGPVAGIIFDLDGTLLDTEALSSMVRNHLQ